MSEESSLDGSEWHNEGDLGSWDSEEDLAVLMSQLCRVCGEATDDLLECFGDKGKEMNLVEKIHTLLPIMVTEEDLLPINVCSTCVSKIEMCHEMVINCLEADTRMRSLLGCDMPATYEEQCNYQRPGSPESGTSSKDLPQTSTRDSSRESPTEEVGLRTTQQKAAPKEKDKKTAKVKSEEKPPYKVILLKLKKTTNMAPEMQIQKALNFLQTGGNRVTVKLNTSDGLKKNASDIKTTEQDEESSNVEENTTKLAENEGPAENEENDKNDKNIKQTEGHDIINYECIYCDQSVIGKKQFVEHQKEAHNNDVYSCDKCEMIYELEDVYEEHLKSHEEEKADKSQEESTEDKNENGKRKNTDTLDDNITKKRKTDEDVIELDEGLLKQIEAESDDEFWKCKVWQCRLCSHVSLSKQGWQDHKCETQELECSICGDELQFTSEKELEEHYQLVHEEESLEERYLKDESKKDAKERQFQCSTCGKLFSTWVQLTQHSRTHAWKFKCPHCERTFSNQTNLAQHVKRHKMENGFTCRICLEVFANRGELLSHRRTHSREELLGLKIPVCIKEELEICEEEGDPQYKCPLCSRPCENKQDLEDHIVVHTENSYPCYICGKVLSKKNTLEYHLRTHTGEKPYTCSMCPGKFQSRVGLIVHERIHTGEKPYQCDQCEMAFRCRATLNQHKVVHSEERPYQCMHCGRGFRRRDTLDTHIRTHTDERPYACRICGRAFRQKGDCSKHEKTHSKHAKSVVILNDTTVYNCPLCGLIYELKEDLDHHFHNEHTLEEKTPSIVIINSDNAITIPAIAVSEDSQGLILQGLS